MAVTKSEYRRGRGPLFAPVPLGLMDHPDADGFTISTYASIKSFADFGSSEGAQVGDARAARRAGVSPRTFRRRREKLRDMGWLEWETINHLWGRVNRYTVHASPPEDGSS